MPPWKEDFRYEIIDQLLRVPAKVSLLDLIKMDKSVRASLLEVLTKWKHESGPASFDCLVTRLKESIPITFDQEDMLLGDCKHGKPLYYTCYIHEVKVSRIQIDPGSAVNILPIQTMNSVGLTLRSLKEINVKIHGYDGQGNRALGKIKIKCKIGDMIVYPGYYVVGACTTCNLLLGRPRIYENHVIPSTLH